MKRRRIPRSELRKLYRFYGDKFCVIDGTTSDVDWHHLDDDSSNSLFVNLIGLRREYNLRLKEYARSTDLLTSIEMDPRLSPEGLAEVAERHLLLQRPALAFGAARLAAAASNQYALGDASDTIRLAALALHCLRHTFNFELFVDLLDRGVARTLSESPVRVSDVARLRFLFEMACLAQEIGAFDDAETLFQLARRFVFADSSSGRFRAAVLRRMAENYYALGRRAEYEYFLSKSYDTRLRTTRERSHLGKIELQVALAERKLDAVLSRRDEVRRRLLSEGERPRPFASTGWNLASSLLTLSNTVVDAGLAKLFDSARRDFRLALQILDQTGSRLSPVSSGKPTNERLRSTAKVLQVHLPHIVPIQLPPDRNRILAELWAVARLLVVW